VFRSLRRESTVYHLKGWASTLLKNLEKNAAQRRGDTERTAQRVVKSHLPYHVVPKGPGRYICGIRNGLDVAVSCRCHACKYLKGWEQCSPGEFFSRFMAGGVPCGSWFEHVAGWGGRQFSIESPYVIARSARPSSLAIVSTEEDFPGLFVALVRTIQKVSTLVEHAQQTKAGACASMPERHGPTVVGGSVWLIAYDSDHDAEPDGLEEVSVYFVALRRLDGNLNAPDVRMPQ
jgi:hypothetical protein